MAHIHEKIDFTVDVFIVHDSKVLLRMHEKYHTLLAVGGHVELDEDPATAAKRECMEEVGLPVTLRGEADVPKCIQEGWRYLPTPEGMNIHQITDTHQHVSLIFFATTPHTNIIPENPTDTWEWLAKEELATRTDIRESITDYALQALEALG